MSCLKKHTYIFFPWLNSKACDAGSNSGENIPEWGLTGQSWVLFFFLSHEYLSVWEGNKFRGWGRDCLFLAEFQPSKAQKMPLRLIRLGDPAKAQHFQRWWPQREVSSADLEKCLDSFSSALQAEGVTLLSHSMSATRWRGSLNFLKVFIPLRMREQTSSDSQV